MTDPITRARTEWCERHAGGGHKYVNVCPEEVVAALLDLREFVASKTIKCRCFACEIKNKQQLHDLIAAVDSAITHALEGES